MNVLIGAAPSAADFEALAWSAFARIPEPFARHLEGITVHIEESDRLTVSRLSLA